MTTIIKAFTFNLILLSTTICLPDSNVTLKNATSGTAILNVYPAQGGYGDQKKVQLMLAPNETAQISFVGEGSKKLETQFMFEDQNYSIQWSKSSKEAPYIEFNVTCPNVIIKSVKIPGTPYSFMIPECSQ